MASIRRRQFTGAFAAAALAASVLKDLPGVLRAGDADPALRPTLPAGEARTDVGPQDVASETRRQDGGDGPAQARENV